MSRHRIGTTTASLRGRRRQPGVAGGRMRINAWLPPEVADAVRAVAKVAGTSLSETVTGLIADALHRPEVERARVEAARDPRDHESMAQRAARIERERRERLGRERLAAGETGA